MNLIQKISFIQFKFLRYQMTISIDKCSMNQHCAICGIYQNRGSPLLLVYIVLEKWLQTIVSFVSVLVFRASNSPPLSVLRSLHTENSSSNSSEDELSDSCTYLSSLIFTHILQEYNSTFIHACFQLYQRPMNMSLNVYILLKVHANMNSTIQTPLFASYQFGFHCSSSFSSFFYTHALVMWRITILQPYLPSSVGSNAIFLKKQLEAIAGTRMVVESA